MEHNASNILEGEASESDEEVSDYPGFMRSVSSPAPDTAGKSPKAGGKSPKAAEGPSSSVVVMGEASESENEEDEFILRRAFPSLDDKGEISRFDQNRSKIDREPAFLMI